MDRLASLQKEGLGAGSSWAHRWRQRDRTSPAGVVRLERYTLESYLVDPIALYCEIVSSRGIDEVVQFSAKGGVNLGAPLTRYGWLIAAHCSESQTSCWIRTGAVATALVERAQQAKVSCTG